MSAAIARQQHQRHEAAVAVADHADTIGIRPRLALDEIDAGELVVDFDVTELSADRILERLWHDSPPPRLSSSKTAMPSCANSWLDSGAHSLRTRCTPGPP